MKQPRHHRWLLALPGLAIGVGVPFADRVRAPVAGLPFLLAWIVGCVLFTSLVTAIVAALDRAADAREAASPADARRERERP